MRFNPPPNWPVPSSNWAPPPGWEPDPSWGEPPPGWSLWVPDDAPTGAGWPGAAPYGGQSAGASPYGGPQQGGPQLGGPGPGGPYGGQSYQGSPYGGSSYPGSPYGGPGQGQPSSGGSKTGLIVGAIVVVAVLIIGVSAFLLSKGGNDNKSQADTSSSAAISTSAAATSSSSRSRTTSPTTTTSSSGSAELGTAFPMLDDGSVECQTRDDLNKIVTKTGTTAESAAFCQFPGADGDGVSYVQWPTVQDAKDYLTSNNPAGTVMRSWTINNVSQGDEADYTLPSGTQIQELHYDNSRYIAIVQAKAGNDIESRFQWATKTMQKKESMPS